jgi:hypothetical protein
MAKVLSICGSEQYNRIQNIDWFEHSYGNILSIGYLVGTKCMGDFLDNSGAVDLIQNKTFVKYNPNLWIWEFGYMTPIEPIPMKGKQGWKILTDEQKSLIKPI